MATPDHPSERPFAVVRSAREIPAFSSEAEEQAFWAAHEFGDELFEDRSELPDDELPPVRPDPPRRSRAISIRLNEDVLDELRAIGKARGVGYQTALKQLLAEALLREAARPARTGSRSRRRSEPAGDRLAESAKDADLRIAQAFAGPPGPGRPPRGDGG